MTPGSGRAPERPRRQTTLVLTLPLWQPDAAALERLDRRLETVLEIPVPEPPAPAAGAIRGGGDEDRAAGLAWRCQLLLRAFMQTAAVPLFRPGRLLELARAPDGGWSAAVEVDSIDHIPAEVYRMTASAAVHVARVLAAEELAREQVEDLHRVLDRELFRPLGQRVSSGQSTLPVLRAAAEQGIPFIHLDGGVYQLGWGSRARRMDRGSCDGDSAMGNKLAQNKLWSANLLRSAGLPAPRHGAAETEREARALARTIGWPVVVKPVDRDRGEAVRVGIRDEGTLAEAFRAAHQASPSGQVLVERQAPGICYRLLVAEGRLLYATARWPISIQGDGRTPVGELIEVANRAQAQRPPWLREERFPADAAAIEAMRAAGYPLDSVPPAGTWVPLRPIETTRDGGRFEDVTERVHPDNADLAIRAARLFGLAMAGVDLITDDIEGPWHASGAIVSEVNFSPLFGVTAISQRHLPAFFAHLLEGDGRIPVEAVLGHEAAWGWAQRRQRKYAEAGKRCFATSHDLTLDARGAPLPFPFDGLYRRCRALLLDPRVDTLVLVVQDDELADTGLPVDVISRLEMAAGGDGEDLRRTRALLQAKGAMGPDPARTYSPT
ncbi:MAG: hypothetical protein U5S82_00770 [Gammaproteobacteria bacterium]|nr:hypothetical protein [Gammaproteobacteria bacterium]